MTRSELAQLLPPPMAARYGAWLGSVLLAALVLWAAFAETEIVVMVPAVARPAGGIAELRAPETRRVTRVAVAAGTTVAAGTVVVALERRSVDERHRAVSAALRERRAALAEDRALLQALAGAPSPMTEAARMRLQEHRARLMALDRDIGALAVELDNAGVRARALRRQHDLAKERHDAVAAAAARGAMSRFEVLRVRQELWQRQDDLALADGGHEVLQERLAAQRHGRAAEAAGFRRALLQSVAALEVEVEQLEAQRAEAEAAQRHSVVTAPVAGVVDRLPVAVGDFVERGEVLGVIVPQHSVLVFEARIPPSQNAFLRPGQPCRLKLDALPFARYGALPCTLIRLGSDVVEAEGEAAYYLAELRPAARTLEADGERLALQPGATAWADIIAGRRTVLEFVTDPLWRFTRESLRER